MNSGAMIGIFIGTAQTIILTRALGPHGIGQYALSIAFLSLAATVFAVGFPLAFLFYAKQAPQEKNIFFANAFWILLAIGLAAGIILAALFHFQKDYFGQYNTFILFTIAIYTPLVLLRVLFRNYLLINIQAIHLTLIEIFAVGISMLFVICIWSIDLLTVDTALISFVLATSIRTLLGWVWIRRSASIAITPSRKYIRKLGLMGIRQIWPDLFTIFNDQVGILLLKLLLEDFSEIGFFSRGVSISTLLILISQAVMPVLFSSWAGLAEEAVRCHVEKVLRFVTSFSLFMVLILVLFGGWIVMLFYGNEFMPSVAPMRILAVGTGFAIISRTLIQLFSGRGMPGRGTLAMAAGSIITALLCMMLIPKWSIIGCAVAIAAGQFLIMLMLLVYGKLNFHLSLKQCAFINRDDFHLAIKSLSKVKAGV